MKRVIPFVVLALTFSPQAIAAPKAIPVGLGSIYTPPEGTESIVQSARSLIYISNSNSLTSDISLISVDLTGAQQWQRTIDSGADEVFTAATVDFQGNIWVAGSAGALSTAETPTDILGIDNPDNIVSETKTAIRQSMNQLAIWKISPAGEIAATYLAPQSEIPIVASISAANSGVSIVGSLNSRSFFISLTNAGTFGKLMFIGTAKSEINSVVRHSDGSSSLFGSSAETLAGKKLAGLRDGVLIRISKSGVITNLVRSSALKASRSWISADSSFLTSGPVITGKVVETAITKFTSVFAPTWTMRLPSTGASRTLSANGNSYLALTSKSAIPGIAKWKPVTPSLLVITFDSKGAMKAAVTLPGLVTPISLNYSKERGVTGLASDSEGTVSIFTLVAR